MFSSTIHVRLSDHGLRQKFFFFERRGPARSVWGMAGQNGCGKGRIERDVASAGSIFSPPLAPSSAMSPEAKRVR